MWLVGISNKNRVTGSIFFGPRYDVVFMIGFT
jgi:hypothetical protein